MIRYTKDDYNHMARKRALAFGKIADALGDKHWVVALGAEVVLSRV